MSSELHYYEAEVPALGDPLLAVAALAESHDSDTYLVYEQPGAWSFATGAIAEITLDAQEVHYRDSTSRRDLPWEEQPLRLVAALLDSLPVAGWRAYGWAGFDLAYAISGLSGGAGAGTLLHVVVPQSEVRIANGRALVRSVAPHVVPRLTELLIRLDGTFKSDADPISVDHGLNARDYCDMVNSVIDEIRQHHLQKVILSRKILLPDDVNIIASFVRGRRHNNPARSFLLNVGGVRAAGFSPETLVEVTQQGRVVTQPLAGTRARTTSAEHNSRLRAELLTDAKEIFEHAISVKAAYDELSDLCLPDSVAVENFMTVKDRGSVQHLASLVAGLLPKGVRCWDAFAALFPAVTASGIPKIAAFACIQRHEPHARGLYGGAVMAIDADGALDAALVLRTLFREGGTTWLCAGAGIVQQSHPERELEETCEKFRSISMHLVRSRTPSVHPTAAPGRLFAG